MSPPPPAAPRPSPAVPEADRRSRELEALYAAAVTMGAGSDLVATAEQTLDGVLAVAGLHVGMVYRLDARREYLVLVASRGLTEEQADRLRERRVDTSHTGEAVRSRRYVVTDLGTSRLVTDPVLRAAIAAGDFHTQLALPIFTGQDVWGVLALVSSGPRTFDGDQLLLLQGVAHQVGLGVSRAALFEETREKTRRLETLARLAQGLSATLSGDQVLERVVGAAIELLGGSIARLWLLDEDGQQLTLGAAAGPVAVPQGLRTLGLGEGLVGLVVSRRAAVTMPDLTSDPRVRNTARLRAEGIVSAAAVPLMVGPRLIGVLAVGTQERHDYSAEELSLLQSLADQAAVAIDNARLFFDEQTRRAYLSALLEINTKIGALAPTDTLLTSIAEEAARLLAVDNAGFRLLEGDDLVLAGLAGTAAQTMLRPRLRMNESVSGRVMTTGRSLILDFDADEAADMVVEHMAADRRLGYTKFLGVPLRVGDRTIGVLTFRARRPFTPRDQELAEAFAGQAAVALEHSRLYRDARQQAVRMRALADLGRVLSETLDPDVVGQRVADSICALLGARSSALYRMAEDGRLVALTVSATSAFEWTRELSPGMGLAGLAAAERRTYTAADVLADPRIRYDDGVRAIVGASDDRALMAVPVLVRDRVFGALAVADRTGRVYDTEDTRLAEAFADQAALALENARLYAESTRRQREAEELARLSRALAESLDVTAVGDRIADSVLTLFSATSSVLRLLRPDGALEARALAGRVTGVLARGHVLAPGTSTSGRAVQLGIAVMTSDLAADAAVTLTDDLRARMREVGDGAQLSVPLRTKGQTIGALSVSDRAGRTWTDAEVRLLQAFADQGALALENARLYAETMRRRYEAEELARLAQTLTESLDVSDVVARAVENVMPLFGAQSSVLRLIQPDGSLVALALGGRSRDGIEPGHVLAPGTGMLGRAAAEGRPVWSSDVFQDSAVLLSEPLREALRRADDGALMAVPLRVKGTVIGALGVADRTGREFTEEEARVLQAFGDQAALALENARLFSLERARRRQIAALAEVEREFAAELDTERLLGLIVERSGRLFDSECVVYLEDDEGQFVRRAWTCAAGGPTRVAPDRGMLGPAVTGRRGIIANNYPDSPLARPDFVAQGVQHAMMQPVVVGGRVRAVLVTARPQGAEPFQADDLTLLESFAAQAGIALENARLYEEARRYAERLRAVEEVNRLVSSSLNVEEVLQNLARAIAQFFDAGFVSLWAYDAATQRLRRALTFGDPELAAELSDDLAVGQGAVGWVVAHREPIMWTGVVGDARILDPAPLQRRGLLAMTAYPIAIGERILGAFAVHRDAAGPVSPETTSLMGSLAAQAAIALENARLYSETSRRLTETRALLEVAEILNSTLQSRTLFKRVTLKIAQVCRADRCTVELWDGDHVVPLMSQFADGRKSAPLWEQFQSQPAGPPAEIPANAHVIETRQPLVIDDCAASPLIPRAWVDTFGLRACLIVPMLRQERVIGVMTLDYCERSARFQDWQKDLALAIAGQLAFALENTRLYAESQERLRETRTLLAVGQMLSQPGKTDVVLRRVASEVGRAFGADMVGIYLSDGRRRGLVPAAGYHVPKDLMDFFSQRPIVLEDTPGLLPAWRAGQAVSSGDVHADPRFDPGWSGVLPPHSVLLAPTMAHGQPVGGLFLVWWRTGRAFPPAEVRLLEGVAAQVGLAMENAELARQTQAKLAETETLLTVSRAVSSTLDVQSLVRHFLRQVAVSFGADTVGLWLVDETGQWLTPLAGFRVPTPWLQALRDVRLSLLDHAIYVEAARTRRPVFSEDAANDPRLPPVIREHAPHQSHLWVPVIAKDRMIGGFAVVWREARSPLTESELALMEAIANQAGVAIENARLFEENRRRVEELSVLHELSQAVTGQLDRAALLEALRTQVARVLDARNLALVLRADDADELEVALRIADGQIDVGEPRRYPTTGTGLMTVVLESGAPLRVDDYAAECARRGLQPARRSEQSRYWLGVPLSGRDRVLGVLALTSSERPFTEAEERLLLNVAHLTALALASVRLYADRTRAYGELAAAQDQLVRTEKLRALGEMASGVAHDFNNLLASVLGRAQLLLRRVQEPQLRQWLQVIERSALDGAQTVRRLQEFTRIRRDQPLVPLDINQVVRDALDLTQSRWKEEPTSRGITLEVHTRLSAVPAVVGDAAELREAMTNLILNAVDAMPAGGTLTLSTALVDERVEVAVADTGVGMPPEVRDKVFDRFFTTKGPQGTGLGLSMTYGIISRHGGSIAVESEPGLGSTFRLSLPRGSDVQPARPEARVETPAVRALRCLVVDDEPPVRAVIGDILESAGHAVVTLGDGGEAIARFQAERFDLVVTDLAMPRVSGWQVARAVKQVAPQVPVFLVTGFGVELSAEERRAHGVDLVLVKPLQIQEILDAVAEVARGANR